ncbi:hypothetical protein KIN20_019720, partial [Parelaphostrongylus tenuis]
MEPEFYYLKKEARHYQFSCTRYGNWSITHGIRAAQRLITGRKKMPHNMFEPLKQKSTCVHEKRVRFAADVKTDPKPKAISPPPKPSDVTAPPPSVPFAIKDEVELLRSGTVNKRGGRVKSQA